MDQFKKLYLEYCKSYHVDPSDYILSEIQKVSSETNKTKSLNLSSFHLGDGQCSILGRALVHDFIFTTIQLNDCNLSNDGLQSILHALTTNTTCKTLELKGNSIQSSGTEALSRLLRRNQTLRCLRLEWNQLGAMNSPAFSLFCDALAENKFLIELDLRNNDINHAAASELVSGLKRNSTLQALDLRWNNVGLVGGRAFLTLCQTNKTLSDVNLIGNNVPDEIMQSIGNALAKNREQRATNFVNAQNLSILSREVKNAHEEKTMEINSALTRMTLQEQSMLKSNRSLEEKLKKLQETLDERKMAFNALTTRNTLLEADLTVARQKHIDFENEIKRIEIDREEMIHRIRREFRQEKEDLNAEKEKLQRQIKENEEIQRRLNEKNRELELREENCLATIRELRETIAMNDRNFEIKINAAQEDNQRLRSRHIEELKEREQKASRDEQRSIEAQKATENSLREQIRKLETIRTSLEREINELKSNLSTEKLGAEEFLQNEKVRWKNEEEKRREQFEDRFRALSLSKDDLEGKFNQQMTQIRELQQKIHFQSIEIENFKRQAETFNLNLSNKESEIIEVREKAKIEFDRKLRMIQNEIDENEQIRSKMKKLETEIETLRENSAKSTRHFQDRIDDLESNLKKREEQIRRFQLDEERRIKIIRNAMENYLDSGADFL